MTSSTNPEVHNVLHCHQRRTERRKQKVWWNLDVWLLRLWERTDTQTDRHTDTLIAILRTLTGEEVTTAIR